MGVVSAILDSVYVEASGPGWLAAPLKSSLTTVLSGAPSHATRRQHVAGVAHTLPGALAGVWWPGVARGRCVLVWIYWGTLTGHLLRPHQSPEHESRGTDAAAGTRDCLCYIKRVDVHVCVFVCTYRRVYACKMTYIFDVQASRSAPPWCVSVGACVCICTYVCVINCRSQFSND